MAKIEVLIEGYRKFYQKYFASGDSLYRKLTQSGQSPKTLVIACSDSRVDPSIIMDTKPGDIFVVRNVANLVPPCQTQDNGLHGVSASLEFAVSVLEVENIVILGHTNCAGIHALLNPNQIEHTDFIKQWMNVARPAKDKILSVKPTPDKSALQHNCEKESLLLSLDNLLTFPWIKSKVKEGKLKLHGWYFSLEEGYMHQYNPTTSNFEKISL